MNGRPNRTGNARGERIALKKVAVFLVLVALIIGVRIYYYTGPVFANTLDEGTYFNIIYAGVAHGQFPTFTAYRNATFSYAASGALFNSQVIFNFYGGLIYPEIFFLKLLGFTPYYAIGYVIATSVVEGIFIMLILSRLASLRAAAIGGVIFAFIPEDVLFGTHLQPLVPAVMFLAIATYLFIIARDSGVGYRKHAAFALSGFFGALGYLTNPSALLFIAFAVLYLAVLWVRTPRQRRSIAAGLVAIAIGFVAGFSITGVYYYMQSGNYLLYPLTDRAVLLGEYNVTANLAAGLQLKWSADAPNAYLPILLHFYDQQLYGRPIVYFSITTYLFIAMAMVLLTKGRKKANIFIMMFAFYFLLLSYGPEQVIFSGGVTIIKLVNTLPYLLELLVLPIVVVSAMGLDTLAQAGSRNAVIAAMLLLLATTVVSVHDLNFDAMYYRAYVYDLHAFVGFAEAHPSAAFYAQGEFASEANLLSGYNYNINGASCSAVTMASYNGYIAIGGYVSMDVDPSGNVAYYECAGQNLTADTPVYSAPDPAEKWAGATLAPPLLIYEK